MKTIPFMGVPIKPSSMGVYPRPFSRYDTIINYIAWQADHISISDSNRVIYLLRLLEKLKVEI